MTEIVISEDLFDKNLGAILELTDKHIAQLFLLDTSVDPDSLFLIEPDIETFQLSPEKEENDEEDEEGAEGEEVEEVEGEGESEEEDVEEEENEEEEEVEEEQQKQKEVPKPKEPEKPKAPEIVEEVKIQPKIVEKSPEILPAPLKQQIPLNKPQVQDKIPTPQTPVPEIKVKEEEIKPIKQDPQIVVQEPKEIEKQPEKVPEIVVPQSEPVVPQNDNLPTVEDLGKEKLDKPELTPEDSILQELENDINVLSFSINLDNDANIFTPTTPITPLDEDVEKMYNSEPEKQTTVVTTVPNAEDEFNQEETIDNEISTNSQQIPENSTNSQIPENLTNSQQISENSENAENVASKSQNESIASSDYEIKVSEEAENEQKSENTPISENNESSEPKQENEAGIDKEKATKDKKAPKEKKPVLKKKNTLRFTTNLKKPQTAPAGPQLDPSQKELDDLLGTDLHPFLEKLRKDVHALHYEKSKVLSEDNKFFETISGSKGDISSSDKGSKPSNEGNFEKASLTSTNADGKVIFAITNSTQYNFQIMRDIVNILGHQRKAQQSILSNFTGGISASDPVSPVFLVLPQAKLLLDEFSAFSEVLRIPQGPNQMIERSVLFIEFLFERKLMFPYLSEILHVQSFIAKLYQNDATLFAPDNVSKFLAIIHHLSIYFDYKYMFPPKLSFNNFEELHVQLKNYTKEILIYFMAKKKRDNLSIEDVGDEANNPSVGKIVRDTFGRCLYAILNFDFEEKNSIFQGQRLLWSFISTCAKSPLSQQLHFTTGFDFSAAVDTVNTLCPSSAAGASSKPQLVEKTIFLFCYGLNSKTLSVLLRALFEHKELLKKNYKKTAPVLDPNFQNKLLATVQSLQQLPFNLKTGLGFK